VKLSWIAAACAGSAVLLAFLSFIREVPDEP
jgi:hypothetical protein